MGTEQKANYAAYIIERLQDELDPEDNPYEDLKQTFLLCLNDPKLLNQFKFLAGKTHLTPTYKVLVTPSLMYFEHATYEEGNLMLREHRDSLFYFMRVAIVDENKE